MLVMEFLTGNSQFFLDRVVATACFAKELKRASNCTLPSGLRQPQYALHMSDISSSGPLVMPESDAVAGMQLQEQQRRGAAELQTLQARCHAAETEAAALRRASGHFGD